MLIGLTVRHLMQAYSQLQRVDDVARTFQQLKADLEHFS